MPNRTLLRVAVVTIVVAAMAGTAGSAEAALPLTPSSEQGQFDPVSVTFVSRTTGWALGRSACSARSCWSLRKTEDSGRLWSSVTLPRPLAAEADGSALNVRFANTEDGWIYGYVPSDQTAIKQKAAIWSTHDGGASWRSVAITGWSSGLGGVLDLEASGGWAYALLYSLGAFGAYEGPLVLA